MTPPTSTLKTPNQPTSKAQFGLPEKSSAEKARAKRILNGLFKHYPDAHCELDYSNTHELLIATILSAQATRLPVGSRLPDVSYHA